MQPPTRADLVTDEVRPERVMCGEVARESRERATRGVVRELSGCERQRPPRIPREAAQPLAPRC